LKVLVNFSQVEPRHCSSYRFCGKQQLARGVKTLLVGRWLIRPLAGLWGQKLVSPQITMEKHYPARNLNAGWGYTLRGAIGSITACWLGSIGRSLGLWESERVG